MHDLIVWNIIFSHWVNVKPALWFHALLIMTTINILFNYYYYIGLFKFNKRHLKYCMEKFLISLWFMTYMPKTTAFIFLLLMILRIRFTLSFISSRFVFKVVEYLGKSAIKTQAIIITHLFSYIFSFQFRVFLFKLFFNLKLAIFLEKKKTVV